MVTRADEIRVVPDPGGGWYYEIRWEDGQQDWGFRLTQWGAWRAAKRLIRQKGWRHDDKESA
jgi:hypothetical protein